MCKAQHGVTQPKEPIIAMHRPLTLCLPSGFHSWRSMQKMIRWVDAHACRPLANRIGDCKRSLASRRSPTDTIWCTMHHNNGWSSELVRTRRQKMVCQSGMSHPNLTNFSFVELTDKFLSPSDHSLFSDNGARDRPRRDISNRCRRLSARGTNISGAERSPEASIRAHEEENAHPSTALDWHRPHRRIEPYSLLPSLFSLAFTQMKRASCSSSLSAHCSQPAAPSLYHCLSSPSSTPS